MMLARRLAPIAALFAAGGAHAQGVPEGYTLVELAPLGGGTASFVSAINERGEIVGRTDSGTGPVATRWDLSGAAAQVTISSGGAATDAVSINGEGLMFVTCDTCGPGGGPLSGVRLIDGTVLELPAPPGPGVATAVPRISANGTVGGALALESPPGSDAGEIFGMIWRLAPGPAMEPHVVGLVAEVTTSSSLRLSSFGGGFISDASRIVIEEVSGIGSGGFYALDARTGEIEQFNTSEGDVYLGEANGTGRLLTNEVGPTGAFAHVFIPGASAPEQIFPINCDGSSFCAFTTAVSGRSINDGDVATGVADVVDHKGLAIGAAAFIWSSETGTVDLHTLIADGSADGWQLFREPDFALVNTKGPADINNAGVIVGNGINPHGDPAAYVLIPRSPCAADTNRDGLVTPADYNAWILAFNNGCD